MRTAIVLTIMLLAGSIAVADGHLDQQGGKVFRGELHVQVWNQDGAPLPDVTVAFHVGRDKNPERLAATAAQDPPDDELKIAKHRDARSTHKTTANVDALVARYQSQAPFWQIGPGTYNVRIELAPNTWSDPIEVTFTPKAMMWTVVVRLDTKTSKLVSQRVTKAS